MSRNLYHTCLAHIRSDTITYESESVAKLLSFFSATSECVVRNIKKIVYSKTYNINYTPYNYAPVGRYKKVIIHAKSENYSEIFTLFHIKKTVTQQDIVSNFKKLYIKDEPIIDFYSIQFFSEGNLSPTDTLNKYQIQYKVDDKTYVEDFYAKDYVTLLESAKNLIDGEITEIRDYQHIDNTVKTEFSTTSYKYISFFVSDDTSKHSFKVTKVKHAINHNELLTHVKNTFTLQGKPLKDENIQIKFG